MSARFEPILGRYMHLDLFGRAHRIYVEQAGEGTPLLCLHTAGADGRQYRALMNDARVTSKHRVIALTCLGMGSRRRRRAGTMRTISSPRQTTRPWFWQS
jgi:pimeloyl-ACP methyl ester carboxylesterase